MFVGFLFCFVKGDVLSDQFGLFVGRRVCVAEVDARGAGGVMDAGA